MLLYDKRSRPDCGEAKERSHATLIKIKVYRMNEIVIVGFPKCGTTALCSVFERDPECVVLRNANGGLEIPWPEIRTAGDFAGAKLPVHKYTSYIHRQQAIEFLFERNPNATFVVCIRDAVKVLLSWHNMHRRIAREGAPVDHFAAIEKEFYSTCTVSEYYYKFARRRLQFADHVSKLFEIVPRTQICIVHQEEMAININDVATFIKAHAKGGTPPPLKFLGGKPNHISYADNAVDKVPSGIINELCRYNQALNDLITN